MVLVYCAQAWGCKATGYPMPTLLSPLQQLLVHELADRAWLSSKPSMQNVVLSVFCLKAMAAAIYRWDLSLGTASSENEWQPVLGVAHDDHLAVRRLRQLLRGLYALPLQQLRADPLSHTQHCVVARVTCTIPAYTT